MLPYKNEAGAYAAANVTDVAARPESQHFYDLVTRSARQGSGTGLGAPKAVRSATLSGPSNLPFISSILCTLLTRQWYMTSDSISSVEVEIDSFIDKKVGWK